jgi:pilus assembly protein CpaB
MPVKNDGPQILVATRSLPVGTIIEADSFKYQPWPKDLIVNAYYLKGQAEPTSLTGTVVRSAVTAGQPLTKGALVKPGDRGFLAAALGPGMRAITVSVSAASGVAGFVFPGDRVDLVLTQTIENNGGGGPALKTSETIVRNLRVLATDQRTTSEDAEGKKEVKAFNTVTIETTPRIAEKIALAQSIGGSGGLSLALRSIADNTSELERAIAAGEVKVPAGADPKAEKSMMLAVATRPSDNNTTFVTGADVSRFQRKSVPKAAAAPAAPAAAPATNFADPNNIGPVIHIRRGSSTTTVPVGAK